MGVGKGTDRVILTGSTSASARGGWTSWGSVTIINVPTACMQASMVSCTRSSKSLYLHVDAQ